jgi:tetratricopeptide (TPR) repeat protein
MKTISSPKLGLLILLSVLSYGVLAQKSKIDSLESLLATKPDEFGGEYVDLLFELARAYGDVDHKKCFLYGSRAFASALKNGDSLRIVKCGRIMAQGYRQLGIIDSALLLFEKVRVIAERKGYQSERKMILNATGTAYLELAQYDKALKFYFENIALSESDNDTFFQSVTLNNIGLVHLRLRDYETALPYFKRSYLLKDTLVNKYDLQGALINIALSSALQERLTEAEEYVNRTFSACKGNCSSEISGYIHYVKGIVSYKRSDFIKAEAEFSKSKSLNKIFPNNKLTLSNLSYLLSISIRTNQQAKVEELLKEVENLIASGIPYNFEILDVYPQLCSYYLKEKNYIKAAFTQNQYIKLRDSLYSDELTTNLMKIEAGYIEKENLAEIESQNKILSLNEEVIRTHKFLNIFIGIVALMFLTLIVVLIKSNRLKQKHNMLLDKKVQERTYQLQLNHDSLQRASQERDIMLQKISTDINNALVTLKGLCSLGMKDIQDPRALEYISKMNTTSESFSNILTKLHFLRSGVGSLR